MAADVYGITNLNQYLVPLVTENDRPVTSAIVLADALLLVTGDVMVSLFRNPAGGDTHDVFVPSDCKTLPLAPDCDGSTALVAAGSAVCPVPPLLMPTVARVVANEPVPEPVTSPVSVMVWSPLLVPVRFNSVLAWATVRAIGVAGAPVLLPWKLLAARLACLARVTAPPAMVAENEPVPEPPMSPVRVMVWSPLLVPDRLSIVFACATVRLMGVAVEPVLFPRILFASMVAGPAGPVGPSLPWMP